MVLHKDGVQQGETYLYIYPASAIKIARMIFRVVPSYEMDTPP